MTDAALARREAWWSLVEGEQERAKAAQRAQALATMRAPSLPSPTPDADEAQIQAVKEDAKSEEFFQTLPPDLQESIADHLVDNGESQYLGGIDAGGVSVRLGDLPPASQENMKAGLFGKLWGKLPNVGSLTLRFTNVGSGIGTTIIYPDGRESMTPLGISIKTAPNSLPLGLNHYKLPETVAKMGKAAPDAWRRLAAYQQSHVWKNEEPEQRPPDFGNLYRSQVLRWLADTMGAEFIADAPPSPQYTFSPPNKTLRKPDTLVAELNRFARRYDSSWKSFQDNIYIVRNNRWYRDDAAEVSSRLLRAWSTRLKAEKNPLRVDDFKAGEYPPATPEQLKAQLDLEADIAASLTPWQISHGLMWYSEEKPAKTKGSKPDPALARFEDLGEPYFPFMSLCERLMRERELARFYADLPDDFRRALCENRLPFAALSPTQQSQIYYLLSIIPRFGEAPSGLLGIGPKRNPNGYVVLTTSSALNRHPDLRLSFVPPPGSLPQP